jgi:hypothetical protein
LGALKEETASRRLGSSTQKGDYFLFLACIFYTLHTSSLTACGPKRLFYAIESSAHCQIQGEFGGEVALLNICLGHMHQQAVHAQPLLIG